MRLKDGKRVTVQKTDLNKAHQAIVGSVLKTGDIVKLSQSHAYPTEVKVVAVTKSSVCVQLNDSLDTLLVFYLGGAGWTDGRNRPNGDSVVRIEKL